MKKYEHKLISIVFDGEKQIAFVLEEKTTRDGDRFIKALIQRTKETIFFNARLADIKVLE